MRARRVHFEFHLLSTRFHAATLKRTRTQHRPLFAGPREKNQRIASYHACVRAFCSSAHKRRDGRVDDHDDDDGDGVRSVGDAFGNSRNRTHMLESALTTCLSTPCAQHTATLRFNSAITDFPPAKDDAVTHTQTDAAPPLNPLSLVVMDRSLRLNRRLRRRPLRYKQMSTHAHTR